LKTVRAEAAREREDAARLAEASRQQAAEALARMGQAQVREAAVTARERLAEERQAELARREGAVEKTRADLQRWEDDLQRIRGEIKRWEEDVSIREVDNALSASDLGAREDSVVQQEEALARRESELSRREGELSRREGEAAAAAAAAATRAEENAKHEAELTAREQALSEVVAKAKQDAAPAAAGGSSGPAGDQGLEAQLRVAKEKLEAAFVSRVNLVQMLEDILRRMRRAMEKGGLGRLVGDTKGDGPARQVLELQQVCERLETLPWAVQELAAREGRGLAHAVAEHVLACYRSRDPNFPLEPAREGVVEAEEEAARAAVSSTASAVAAGFRREVPPSPAPGDDSEDSADASAAD
jgi:hypothetical protein